LRRPLRTWLICPKISGEPIVRLALEKFGKYGRLVELIKELLGRIMPIVLYGSDRKAIEEIRKNLRIYFFTAVFSSRFHNMMGLTSHPTIL